MPRREPERPGYSFFVPSVADRAACDVHRHLTRVSSHIWLALAGWAGPHLTPWRVGGTASHTLEGLSPCLKSPDASLPCCPCLATPKASAALSPAPSSATTPARATSATPAPTATSVTSPPPRSRAAPPWASAPPAPSPSYSAVPLIPPRPQWPT